MIETAGNTFGIEIIPQNDEQRLNALRRYQLLDTPPEEAFTNLAHLIATYFNVPIALISLVDKDRVQFKGNVGMPGVKNVGRGKSLCSLAVLSEEPTIVDKPLEDPCLLANPLVHGNFGLRFYAGAPLTTEDGYNIGTVCIIDKKERTFPDKEREQLVRFSKLVMHQIEMRLIALQQRDAESKLEKKVQERTEELQKAQQEIEQSKKFIKNIVDHAPIGIVVYNAVRNDKGKITDFKVKYYNTKGNSLTGYTPNQRENYSFHEILKDFHYEDHFDRYIEVVEKGTVMEWEQYVEKTQKWLSVTVTKIDDGFLRTLSDITDLKKSEQELQQESAFANSVLDASINGVLVLDAIKGADGSLEDFQIIKINKAFTTILGLDESLVGKRYQSYFPHTHESGVFAMYRQVLETGHPVRKEIYSIDQDLNSWFDVSVVRRNENGVVVTFTNISSQRKAAILLEVQKNLLDNILKYSPSGITVTEFIRNEKGEIVDGRTILANEVSEKHSGIPVEKALNTVISETLPGILESPLFQKALHTQRTGEPFITQYYVEPTGRWIELSVAKMDEDHLINVFTDVTPIKQAHLRLEETVNQLKQSNEELEQFTYVSHHDLQEPLRKISIFSDMVMAEAKDKLSEEGWRRLERVSQAASRMSKALRDVLNFASLKKEELYQPVNLNEVFDTVLKDLELVISEKKAQLSIPPLPLLQAVEHQMHQLFYNLVNNALKFSKPGIAPVIKVSYRLIAGISIKEANLPDQHRQYHEIIVQDNGIGFNQAFADKIFGMFQRLHSKDAYAGTGIGLALAKKVAANHGGTILAFGEKEEGAVFKVYLPAH